MKLFYIEFGKGYRRFEWKMKTRRVEKLDLGLVKSREDEIILFYIEFGKGYRRF